jgi:hypothetical protein
MMPAPPYLSSIPFPKVEIRPRRSMTLFALLSIFMVAASYVFVILLAAACVYLPYVALDEIARWSGSKAAANPAPICCNFGRMLLDPQQRTQRAGCLFGAGLGLALVDQGWTQHSGPGVFHLRRGTEELNPFSIIEQSMSGQLTAQNWVARCQALGIGQLMLRAATPRQLDLVDPSTAS